MYGKNIINNSKELTGNRGSKSPLSMAYIIAYICVKEQRVDGSSVLYLIL